MLLIEDGAGWKQRPIMLVGEEDGWLQIAEINDKGLLKFVN